jgi:hypothetical protein
MLTTVKNNDRKEKRTAHKKCQKKLQEIQEKTYKKSSYFINKKKKR